LDSGKGFAQFCGHAGSGMSRSVSDLKQLFAGPTIAIRLLDHPLDMPDDRLLNH
jgi:hypothetical protein